MWLHLVAGSLLIVLTSNFWNAALNRHSSQLSHSTATFNIAGNHVQFLHRGSGRRDMVRGRIVAGRA